MVILTSAALVAAIAAAPEWSVGWSPRVDAARDVLGQSYQPRRQTTEIAYRPDSGTEVQFAHEFRDLDLPEVAGIPADTNGFVHRLTFAWQRRSATSRMRLGITVATSSNALKQPTELDASDLQPAVGAAWHTGPLWLALYADDRLGRTLVYPGFELMLAPAASHEVRLGFPETSWHWHLTREWLAVAALQPDGACWQVRDQHRDERRSDVCSRGWQAAWTLKWQPTSVVGVAAFIGRRFSSTLDYQLADERRVRVDVAAANFYGATFSARF